MDCMTIAAGGGHGWHAGRLAGKDCNGIPRDIAAARAYGLPGCLIAPKIGVESTSALRFKSCTHATARDLGAVVSGENLCTGV